MTTLIRNIPTATIEQAITFAKGSNPQRPDEVVNYLRELWRLCIGIGYDPAVLAAQSAYETADPNGAGPWESEAWVRNLNPAGIGVTDGADVSIRLYNGVDAARLHVQHMSGYVEGGDGWNARSAYVAMDPRWYALLATEMDGTVRTVEDLGGGVWATQKKPTYANGVLSWLARLRGADQPADPDVGTLPDAPADAKSLLPPITWVDGCQNYHARRNGTKPIFLVRHITDDFKTSNTVSWFLDPNSQASSNFVIDTDGTVLQFVSSLNAPWTNGDVNLPRTDIPALTAAIVKYRAGQNFNDFCVTIEHVGKPATKITRKQEEASIALGKYFSHPDVYGIPPHRYGQLRHSDINSVSRAYCPDGAVDLERIITAQGGDPTRMKAED